MRRNVHKKEVRAVLCLVIFFLCYSAVLLPRALAESLDVRTAKLVEAAKREGSMILYTAYTISDVTKILNGFNRKYPFIKTLLYRTGSEKLTTRILAEARANKNMADALLDSFAAPIVIKAGLAMKYVSPESTPYPKDFKDPQGFWTAAIMVTRVLGYNTKLVDPQYVPKRYEDLLDHRWYGKMGMAEDTEWFAAQFQIMGRKKALEFMKALSQQKILHQSDKSIVPHLLAAGEFSIAVVVNGHAMEQLKRQGAPVEWVAIEPVATLTTPIMVMARAPHPNAAKLFVDYVLSVEGQKYIQKIGRIPLHPNVLPDPPRLIQGLKLMPPDPSLVEKAEEYRQLYRDIFLK